MERKMSIISTILEAFALCFLTLIISMNISALIPSDAPGEANIGDFGSVPFNSGWIIEEDGNTGPVTLPGRVDCKSGETVIIRNILPDDISDGMTMLLRTSIEDIYVYIDGELRECYATSQFENMNYYLPSAYIVVDLKNADAGKPVEVHVTVKDKKVLNEIRLSNGNNAWFKIIRSNIAITVIALIVVILGLVSIALYLIFYKRLTVGRSVFYLGLLMTDIGLWSLSESRLRQIIFSRPSLSTYFAYFSMELAGVLTCMYLSEVQAARKRTGYLILESVMSLQIIINIILSLTGIAELYKTLIVSHVWFVFGIALILYYIITDIINRQTGDYMFILVGMGIFILFVVLELFNFYINPFRSFGAYICTGLLFLLISTLIQETNKFYRLRTEKTLADAANKAKSDFLASMSHEIRTPINAILGMNELIMMESNDPSITEYADNIETAGNTLMGIINDILDLSKIESGKAELISVDYDPALVIADACAMIEKRAIEKGLSLNVHVDSELPVRLKGDEKKLRQILANLLTNAVKYTEKGQVILTVNAQNTDSSKVYMNISVKDTGIGIRPEDRDRLLQSFTRLDAEKNRNIEGSGLGLSIVSRFLGMMGSELKFESVYGVGSDFYFEIIQEISDVTPIGDYEKHTAQRRFRQKSHKSVYAPGVRILMIDDRPLNLAVIRGFLKNSGIIADEALSGEEGILLMKSNHYDMVFFDHMMPGLDGIETYRKCIDEGILSSDTPAIMMTANAVAGSGDDYLNAGFTDYIFKPVSSDELFEIITKHLNTDKVSPGVREVGSATTETRSVSLDKSKGMDACMGDSDLYQTVIEEFLKEQDDISLKAAYDARDWDKYRMIVHSIKSSARYIGATQLHDLAYACEASLKKGDHEYAKQNHERLLALYSETVSSVKA